MFRNILIATDGRDMSWHAIAHGVGLAKALGANVTAVTITAPHEPGTCLPWLIPGGQEARTSTVEELASWYLAAVSAAACAAGVTCDTVEVIDANPARGLMETAQSRKCDLIALGTRARSGLDLALLGSVTREVITSGNLPVLVCRSPVGLEAGTAQPSVPTESYRHILIATDGSDVALRGVITGLDLARGLGAVATAVTITAPWLSVAGHAALWDPGTEYAARMAIRAAEHLAAAQSEADRRNVPLRALHISHEHPHRGLLETAARQDCDLLVMTTHGRSGIRAMLLGSVTASVLAHASLPILVCR